mgnify:CR=1 FL=1|jgi:DNA-binding MurR/RpiR family transcriptional regulator
MNEMTTERIEALIMSKYKSLSRNQRKVADYILNNMNESAFLSVVEIGTKCGASKATVVRFAQTIGFEGFIDFRNGLHSAVQTKFSNMDRFPLISNSDKETINAVAQQEVKNINQTIESLNLEAFNGIINLCNKSNAVYTFGHGISALMSQILALSLNQVGVKTISLVSTHMSIEEQMMFLSSNDVVIFFSFSTYSQFTIDAARKASEKGAKVVVISDAKNSAIVPLSTYNLFVQHENVLIPNSFAAISVLINALTSELSVLIKEKNINLIK